MAKPKPEPSATSAVPLDGKVKPSETMKMPGDGLIKDALRTAKAKREGTADISKAFSDDMGEHKTAGVHPRAIAMVEAELAKAKKTDRGLVAVATFFAHLDFYRDKCGLTDLLKKQGQMFSRTEAGEEASESSEPEPGTPPGERDVRPKFLQDRHREAGEAVDDAATQAKH